MHVGDKPDPRRTHADANHRTPTHAHQPTETQNRTYLDYLREPADHPSVVLHRVQLDTRLDYVNGAQGTVSDPTADAACHATLEEVHRIERSLRLRCHFLSAENVADTTQQQNDEN